MPIPQQLPYILSTSDLYLTPVYIILLFFVVKKLKKKYYSDSPLRVYILPAFFIHMIGSIFFALVYQYYYGYGDTYGFFTGAREIWESFLKNHKVFFELVFVNRENFSQVTLDLAPYGSYTGFAMATSAIVRIAGIIGLFCFGSYLPIALVFGLFSFWGTWLIYITINKHFPHLYKYTALACLFIPSVIIWSSGVTKEPPCMFAIGLCFYSFDKMLHKRGMIRHTIYFITGAIILLTIKNYIFYTFAIAAFAWAFHLFMCKVKNYLGKLIIRSIILVSIFGFAIYLSYVPENTLYQKFMDGLKKGENLQELMTWVNETYGGSGYTLPSLNTSVGGFIKSFFLSLNVTLFRPYPWECTNLFMLMSFLESFGTFLLVLIVLFKVGIMKIIRYSNEYPVLFFMIVFTFLLGPIVGFISYNFGTLARYKIPFLPFFISFLVIVLFDKKNEVSKKSEPALSN